jgi:predicted DsbA family dithiol-disulfide isomerase
MMAAEVVEVRWASDVACSWSWGSEPKLRRLIWEFGEQLRFSWVMGGLARSYGPSYRDSEGNVGSGGDCYQDLISHWLDVAGETGMPIDPRLWTRAKPTSSYPACQAVIAASEQGWEAGYRYLRRLREAWMTERKKLDHAEALIAEAAGADLDLERFEIDLRSHAIVEAFGAHLEEVRAAPEEAREQGKVKLTEGNERVAFPSAWFIGADGVRHGVYGWQPYERYRDAALAAGADPSDPGPADAIAVIERFGACATREVEEISGRPRPVVEAELWALARDWKLKATPVLTGVIWDRA